MRSRCSNERGGPYVFTITVLILAVFLLFRLGILLVQKYHDARGAGRSFKRMLKSGALDAQVYEEAVWSEVEHFGKKRLRAKISREQQRIIRAAKTQMRDDFLDDIQPGFYQYIIIFLIASILGLVLEMVWMFVMFGIVESRVGLVWGPFSPLYGFGAVLLTMLLWKPVFRLLAPERSGPAHTIPAEAQPPSWASACRAEIRKSAGRWLR